ncbi:MAG: YceI family protein [Planctomycetota bacterium]|jgi:polyisoprenoid-binding protein YceI
MKRTLLTLALSAAMVAVFQSRSESQTAAKDYQIDGVHSSVMFKVSHLGVSNTWGRFNAISGSLKFGGEGNAINVTIKADSVDTNNAKRDGHLKSPDFFSAKEFPEITFKSTGWKKTGDTSYDVTGNLTLHGTTKSVTIPVTKIGEGKDPWGGYRVGFDGALKIKRSEYGMGKMIGPAGDDVTLHISIEGMRKL